MYKKDPTGFVGQFFYDCFPTIEHWAFSVASNETAAEKVLGERKLVGPSLTEHCKDLGRNVAQGRIDHDQWHNNVEINQPNHMKANYKHNMELTTLRYPKKEVLVVRLEHLWEDMKQLDSWLGGDGSFEKLDGLKKNVADDTNSEKSSLSEEGTKLFCCLLLEEMEMYRHLVELALNLNDEAKADTIQIAAKQCYFPTWEIMISTCRTYLGDASSN
jgi:hypothetical protein